MTKLNLVVSNDEIQKDHPENMTSAWLGGFIAGHKIGTMRDISKQRALSKAGDYLMEWAKTMSSDRDFLESAEVFAEVIRNWEDEQK